LFPNNRGNVLIREPIIPSGTFKSEKFLLIYNFIREPIIVKIRLLHFLLTVHTMHDQNCWALSGSIVCHKNQQALTHDVGGVGLVHHRWDQVPPN
jgi:hypothetical protein